MSRNILAINPGHNGSVAFLVDGELIYYAEEERISRLKYDGNPFRAMLPILHNYTVDELVIGGTTVSLAQLPWTNENAYAALVRKFNPNVAITLMGHLHHLGHAASAFYNSGFETAVAVVVDGAGSQVQESIGENGATSGYETESIYQCSYPNEFNAVFKRYADNNTAYYDNGIQEFDNSVTITKAYEAVSDYLGFGFIEAGKTMGLAPYGEADADIPDFFINDKGNKNLLLPFYPAGSIIDEFKFPYLRKFSDPRAWHNDFSLVRDVDKNIAFKVQQQTEEQVMNLIQKALDTTGETNVVLSGGFALNCVANYKYVQQFPDINFYIDPIAHDGGSSIGLAKLAWFNFSKEIEACPLNTLYLGIGPDYNQLDVVMSQVPSFSISDVSYIEVAQLLADGNIVAIFQGKAEGGPRALGNRSILFDPRRADGKEFVNLVKKREWFRPFAGSVMLEHASDYFDLAGLKESPFMMYAVNVWPTKLETIPAITHVDGTCRVQTVSAQDNLHYYALISAFNDITGVPILFNTSFNLAGQPLVENVIDAANTILSSDMNYLYFPELGKLITKA